MNTLLLLAAALLGLLAFFEPCAIATHTLYAARAHGLGQRARRLSLLAIWVSRSLLTVGLFTLIVWTTESPSWGRILPSLILATMATLYLVSRFIYIPVPHLEFHRLIPGGARLPESARLGLSLPACTIPLFLVVAGLVMTVDLLPLAIVAGMLFAAGFTLPIAIVALQGVSTGKREFFQHAATVTPYFTAFLLYGFALYLLVPEFNIDANSLRTSLSQASLLGIGISFLVGFVFSFNPVAIASIPVVLAYVTKSGGERRAIAFGGAFIGGMIVTHVTLGVAAALGGEWVKTVMGRHWGLLLGPILVVLGLLWPGWIKLRLPWIGLRGKPVAGLWQAFLLGIPFSIAVCPFCTPALLVALTSAAAIGSVPFGIALLLAFALGRSIPILLGAWAIGWLESLRVLSRYQKIIETCAGLVLILTGLYLLNEYFFIIE